MKKLRYDYMYLGGALVFLVNLTPLNWKFYAIIIPFIIMETIITDKK